MAGTRLFLTKAFLAQLILLVLAALILGLGPDDLLARWILRPDAARRSLILEYTSRIVRFSSNADSIFSGEERDIKNAASSNSMALPKRSIGIVVMSPTENDSDRQQQGRDALDWQNELSTHLEEAEGEFFSQSSLSIQIVEESSACRSAGTLFETEPTILSSSKTHDIYICLLPFDDQGPSSPSSESSQVRLSDKNGSIFYYPSVAVTTAAHTSGNYSAKWNDFRNIFVSPNDSRPSSSVVGREGSEWVSSPRFHLSILFDARIAAASTEETLGDDDDDDDDETKQIISWKVWMEAINTWLENEGQQWPCVRNRITVRVHVDDFLDRATEVVLVSKDETSSIGSRSSNNDTVTSPPETGDTSRKSSSSSKTYRLHQNAMSDSGILAPKRPAGDFDSYQVTLLIPGLLNTSDRLVLVDTKQKEWTQAAVGDDHLILIVPSPNDSNISNRKDRVATIIRDTLDSVGWYNFMGVPPSLLDKLGSDPSQAFPRWYLKLWYHRELQTKMKMLLKKAYFAQQTVHSTSHKLSLPSRLKYDAIKAWEQLALAQQQAAHWDNYRAAVSHLESAILALESFRSDEAFLEPLDFPAEQYAALLAPLIFPLLIPLLISLIRESKRYRELEAKKKKLDKDKKD